MRRLLIFVLALYTLGRTPVFAESSPPLITPGRCTEKALLSGARALFCVPTNGWNGSLVVYAHGYTAPGAPLSFTDLKLADGTKLTDLYQQMGFAFATTTYRQNGFAIPDDVEDVVELVKAFPVDEFGPPGHTYITGAAEGALVTVLAAEQHPDVFDAAMATCGPVGNLAFQFNYIGDFRVLFDAYFPGLLPGSVIDVPASVQANWESSIAPGITAAIRRDPARARELLTVARVPFDARDPKTLTDATVKLLWYNVVGFGNMKARLGGNFYDNRLRWYSGSSNDASLNLRVKRVDADIPALLRLQRLSPSGDLRVPLVTLHTTGDELVPYAHELLYSAKAKPAGRGRLLPLPILRYGHCALATSEVLAGFALMLGAGITAPQADTMVADAFLAPPMAAPLLVTQR